MSSFEFNKLAASLLVALIVAMVTGLVAEQLVHPKRVEQAAYPIAGGESTETQAAAPAAPEKPAPSAADVWAKADATKGADIAKKCAACHDFTKGGPNKVGPNLFGIVGDKKGEGRGFNFSAAMKAKGGTWTIDDLSQFIDNPKGFVPGTAMGFAGIQKGSERADVIAYLNSLSDSPQPLPTAAK